nr:hypothetical protein [Tanacetum cinerariifolium]
VRLWWGGGCRAVSGDEMLVRTAVHGNGHVVAPVGCGFNGGGACGDEMVVGRLWGVIGGGVVAVTVAVACGSEAAAMVEKGGGAWRRWVVDWIYRDMGNIFGVHKKSSPDNFSGGGSRPEMVVAGRRCRAVSGDEMPVRTAVHGNGHVVAPVRCGFNGGGACGDEMVVARVTRWIGDGEMAGDGGGWRRWLLWMAAAAMVEKGGGAWRRWVVDWIDRDTGNIFAVRQKSSPKNFSGGGSRPEMVVAGRRLAGGEGREN